MSARIPVVVGVVAAALAFGWTGCGGGGDDPPEGETSAQPTHQAGGPSDGTECTPTVMVVRHGEDKPDPGGPDILSDEGNTHARLYPKLFRDYLAEPHKVGAGGMEVSVCPIGKIIAINPNENPENLSPGTNPYETIKPLAVDLKLVDPPEDAIQVEDPDGVSYSTVYDWDSAERLEMLLDNGSDIPTSTVIAWDKQGLNPSKLDSTEKSITSKEFGNQKLGSYKYTPLLRALPTNEDAIASGPGYTPQRTDFYVFALQDPDTGKLAFAKAYQQCFSNDGGSTWTPSPTANSSDIKLSSRRYVC